ncbi:HpcH/HpaI aldolase/citrate lyase family protein [Prosthecomicrobium sp. N25]|uniref:HpcH/HpaI aldolase/citrate lyase family protein n=1 Tax=Prosthecomicrobium sp. N25 TaxID=3129254 RepID=UPI0030784671
MDRPPDLRRSVLFVAGADARAHADAIDARADVLVQDLEDFTPPTLKDEARRRSSALFARARAAGSIVAVRVNRLDDGGLEDLDAVIAGEPALILLPKADGGRQIIALADAIEQREVAQGLRPGGIEIVPTAETALGVVRLEEMAQASARVRSCLLGAEDLAADLMAERGPDGDELAYARRRFLLECRAAGIEPIDAPYTYSDEAGCERETLRSRRLGYRCKSTVTPAHVGAIHRVLTPGEEQIEAARRVVAGFEAARAEGKDRALVDGLWIEPPAYRNAQRLLARADQFARASRPVSAPR